MRRPSVLCWGIPVGVVGNLERLQELVAGGPVSLQCADAAQRDAADSAQGVGVAEQVLPYVVLVEPRGAAGDVYELRVGRPLAEQRGIPDAGDGEKAGMPRQQVEGCEGSLAEPQQVWRRPRLPAEHGEDGRHDHTDEVILLPAVSSGGVVDQPG
ncbi:hypothetical protein ACTPOK_09430 [Streptomyces inhibens]|uniref:hypothetical protein n=1 Tax=Streptomyces inhibens TaxID=2293571 RepID=UPI00402A89DA